MTGKSFFTSVMGMLRTHFVYFNLFGNFSITQFLGNVNSTDSLALLTL